MINKNYYFYAYKIYKINDLIKYFIDYKLVFLIFPEILLQNINIQLLQHVHHY